jgi:hypothetical protein
LSESELDRIDPDGAIVTLSSGLQVEVVRLQTRQFFRLLKVLTHGGGEALVRMLDFNADAAEFGQRLLVAVLFSIPDAENEAVQFVQSMCRPPGVAPPEMKRATKAQAQADDAAFEELGRALFNPPLEDTVSIIETVIKQESEDIQALGKRLSGLLKLAERTGQLKPGRPEPAPTPAEMAASSSDGTPPSSTSSRPTTGGPTNGFSGPGSEGSVRSARHSRPGESGSLRYA